MGAMAILFLKWRFPMEIGSNKRLVFMISPVELLLFGSLLNTLPVFAKAVD